LWSAPHSYSYHHYSICIFISISSLQHISTCGSQPSPSLSQNTHNQHCSELAPCTAYSPPGPAAATSPPPQMHPTRTAPCGPPAPSPAAQDPLRTSSQARVHIGLSGVLADLGDLAWARALLHAELALAVTRRARGARHPDIAVPLAWKWRAGCWSESGRADTSRFDNVLSLPSFSNACRVGCPGCFGFPR
jgi:hypothetical protein